MTRQYRFSLTITKYWNDKLFVFQFDDIDLNTMPPIYSWVPTCSIACWLGVAAKRPYLKSKSLDSIIESGFNCAWGRTKIIQPSSFKRSFFSCSFEAFSSNNLFLRICWSVVWVWAPAQSSERTQLFLLVSSKFKLPFQNVNFKRR